MGLNSEEGFTEVDENGDMADRVGVKVLQLNPVEVEKATEERTSGEGKSSFSKRTERNDFVDAFHGERITKGKAPIDKISLLKQTSQHQICEIVARTLTNRPFASCCLRFFQVLLVGLLRRHFKSVKPRVVRTTLGGYSGRLEDFRLCRAAEGRWQDKL
jgi:hypothetical protein